MSELARQVLVSRSRLTYRVDRLAEVGYVTREECEDDRRGLWAILTESGAAALEGATESHQDDVERWFLTHMSDEDLDMMTEVMQRIDESLSGNRPSILR
jgi:DNA-binding MarR family transcriptional regulator